MTSFYGSVNGGQGGSGGEGIDTSTLLQKNDPTFNGTITGPNAHFTGTVQIPEPTEDNHAATKAYVDAALADVDLSEVTTRIDVIEATQDELAAQLDDKVDAENPAFTGTATLDGKNIAYKYSKIQNCKQELDKVKNFWKMLLRKITSIYTIRI